MRSGIYLSFTEDDTSLLKRVCEKTGHNATGLLRHLLVNYSLQVLTKEVKRARRGKTMER